MYNVFGNKSRFLRQGEIISADIYFKILKKLNRTIQKTYQLQ